MEKVESVNKSIASFLMFFFVENNNKEIKQAYISRNNFNFKNKVFLLMITDGEKWHYHAVKNLSALLRGVTSEHDGDYYCINCLYSLK